MARQSPSVPPLAWIRSNAADTSANQGSPARSRMISRRISLVASRPTARVLGVISTSLLTRSGVARSRASFVVADAADTSLPGKTADAVMCIDALQLVPDKSGLLREVARVLRPGDRLVITTWERHGGESADLPPEGSIAALAGTAGLRILVREQCDDWLEQQAFFRQVIAEDSDQAEPAPRLLAEDGRAVCPTGRRFSGCSLVACT